MKFSGLWVWAAVVAAVPAHAEEVQFRGHVLEVDASQEARPVTRIVGTRYEINATAAQVADKARACLSTRQGVTDVSTDAGSGAVSASLQVAHSSFFSSFSVRSRLTVEAEAGAFRLVQAELAQSTSTEDPAFTPIPEASDKVLEALLDAETALVDCLYK